MFRWTVENGIIVSVAFLIICLFGVLALFSVPIQMTPNIDKPVISVDTRWPGATPYDVEHEILIEQEEYLRKVRGVETMLSEASMGRARIDLEFALDTDMDQAMVLVNNALSQVAAYPENVDQPQLRSGASTGDAFIFYNVRYRDDAKLPPDARPVYEMQRWLEDNLGSAIERLPGISGVRFNGASRRQVNIALDPAKLAARDLSMQDVRNAIRQRNRDSSGGDIDTGKRRYIVRTLGRFNSIEEIQDCIIAMRDGLPVRLSDVGEARFGQSETVSLSKMNGRKSLFMMPTREPGANVIEVKHLLEQEIARLNEDVLKPKGLIVEHYADDVGYVVAAIGVVQKNLALGALLACLVLYLFLRSSYPTLLGALGIPICTLGAFLGLVMTGRTINVISLAGIAFALGMTLDNSIVALENIYRHRGLGKKPFQASIDGITEVWKAILASTLTTVFVFLPIVLISDEAGQLYSDIAIAISSAILLSMLVAICMVPAAAARLPFTLETKDSVLVQWARQISRLMNQGLQFLLFSRKRALLFSIAMLTVSVLGILLLVPKAEYLPEGEEPKMFAMLFSPPGYNIQEMTTIGEDIDRRVEYSWLRDGEKPLLNPNATAALAAAGDDPLMPPMAYWLYYIFPERIVVIAEPLERSQEQIEAMLKATRALFSHYPGMITFVNRGSIFSGNTGGTRAVNLDISGNSFEHIYASAMKIYMAAQEAFDKPQIRPQPGLSLSQPSIEIFPDWARVQEAGLNPAELGYMIWALSDGAYVDEFFLGDQKIDIYIYSSDGLIKKPEDLNNLPVFIPAAGNMPAAGSGDNAGAPVKHNKVVPLSSLVRIEETVSVNTIRRVNARRTVTLTIIPPPDISLEEAVDITRSDIISKLKPELPRDINVFLSGASDKLSATRDALSINFLIAIVLSYLLLVAILSHWTYPLLILLTLPLGIFGGLTGLWLMNMLGIRMPFDMITMLGMIVLIGTVVNNPILLVEQARLNLAQGQAARDAVINSVNMRFRPIMMSMLTTAFGLAPVVFLSGAGTELYRGLGTIVLFGLFFSTLFNLSLTPALLYLLFNRSHGEHGKDKLPA